MKKYYFFLFLCLLTFYVIEAQELKWQTTSINTNTDNQRFDDVFFLNENLGWAANGYHAAVYKTTDGGLNWTEQVNETILGEDLYFRNIEFLNENIGFIGTLNNKVYKTTNGGSSWSLINNITPNPKAICGFDAVGANTVYGCGAYFEPAYIIKSIDSGLTWQYIDMSSYATALVEIKFIDENIGYAAGKSATGGIVLKTTNGGANWTEIYNSGIVGEYVWKLQVFESNSNIIFGAVEAVSPNLGKLIKTNDAGVNWSSNNAPETDIQAVGFVSETHGWMGGHATGIFETKDGGITWADLGIGGNLNRIFVINPTTVFASGTTVYKYTSQTLSVEDNNLTKRKPLEIKMFENPVDKYLKFNIQFNSADNLLIELYDITGKRIKQLSRESNIQGSQNKSYRFLVDDLSSGIYTINFHNNTGRQSLKFIKK